jgi:kinesin family protein 23
VSDLDDDFNAKKKNTTYALYISYIEIYNEKLYDLLDDTGKKIIHLKENQAGQVFVSGLKELLVKSVEVRTTSVCCKHAYIISQEGMELLAKGFKNRQVGHTDLNSDSSRSHAVIMFKLVQIPKDKDLSVIRQVSIYCIQQYSLLFGRIPR